MTVPATAIYPLGLYSTKVTGIADLTEGVTALEASLIPTSLPVVAAAIIINDFVEKADLEFEDALVKDDPAEESALPYVNVFAVRTEDKDNETLAQGLRDLLSRPARRLGRR